jgi:hypothetical protein
MLHVLARQDIYENSIESQNPMRKAPHENNFINRKYMFK